MTNRSEASRRGDVVALPGGTFSMGSDRHYASAPTPTAALPPGRPPPQMVDTGTSHLGFRLAHDLG